MAAYGRRGIRRISGSTNCPAFGPNSASRPESDLTLRQPTLGHQPNRVSLNVDPIRTVWKSGQSASAYVGSQDSRSPPVAGPSVRPDGQDEESERAGVPFGAPVRKKVGRDGPNPLNRIGPAGFGSGFRASGSG